MPPRGPPAPALFGLNFDAADHPGKRVVEQRAYRAGNKSHAAVEDRQRDDGADAEHRCDKRVLIPSSTPPRPAPATIENSAMKIPISNPIAAAIAPYIFPTDNTPTLLMTMPYLVPVPRSGVVVF